MANQFTIDVKVKPYVRQYLVNNCGSPVNLALLPDLYRFFIRKLSVPCVRFESLPISDRNEYVSIVVSHDHFYRYGYEISRTDQMDFNSEVEKRLKFIMRTYIGNYTGMYPVAKSIRLFQERFGFSDEVWSFDAIKKDIDRNTDFKRSKQVDEFFNMVDRRLHKIFLENLSDVGTITKNYKYELAKV